MAKKNFMGAFGDVVTPHPKQDTEQAQAEQTTAPREEPPEQVGAKVQINAVIDAELKAKLGVIAARQGVKKKELLNTIIAEYVKQHYKD